jgi:hypothetical protein
MSIEITMKHIRALAGKRGYRVIVDIPHIHVIKKSDEHVKHTFDLDAPFGIDPARAQQFTFICISFWIRGYDLTCEEKQTVRVQRASHHSAWDLANPREAQFVYQDLLPFLSELAWWVYYLETHHCPYLEMLPEQKKIATSL